MRYDIAVYLFFFIMLVLWGRCVMDLGKGRLLSFFQIKSFSFRGLLKAFLLASLCLSVFFSAYIVHSLWSLKGESVTVQRWHGSKMGPKTTHGPGASHWSPMAKISLYAVYAVVAAEDARFFNHCGLDFAEIWHSFQLNWRKNRIVRGASTITQQVVKMVFLYPARTWERKIIEAIYALFLEMMLTKEEILTWYLNLVPFGSGVYGINKASSYYFGKSSLYLGIEDAVKLALVIPSPGSRGGALARKSLGFVNQKRFYQILLKMLQSGYISKRQWEESLARGDFGRPISYSSSSSK